MTHDADILDQRDPIRGPFLGAVTLHAMIFTAIAVSGWIGSHTDSFGDRNAGGIVGIEAVSTIPIPHQGPQNPVANESESEVPQAKTKPLERVKEEKPPPDAVPLKSRKVKKTPAEIASTTNRFRPFDQLDQNQLTTKNAPQVQTPLFSAKSGSGQVGTGANTTLGFRFGGYAAQIQQLIAQHWRTSDVDPRIQTATPVIATFELLRDGNIRNLQILQGSNISSLDFSVKRAILDASPFPPIPPGFEKDYAKVEFIFELKR
jgi:TonB family protein